MTGSSPDTGGARTVPARRHRLRSFHELTERRVHRVLLVSSAYDSFIMSEEGHLHESLLNQFLDLNLNHFPDLRRVGDAEAALAMLRGTSDVDLVVASVSGGASEVRALVAGMRREGLDTPVIALAYTGGELRSFLERGDSSGIERCFLWQGDVRLLLAMVKLVEDSWNAVNDSGRRGVPVILVVEDSVRFYSSYLPAIYTEIYRHAQDLLAEGLNRSQKMMRLRARPKVLLCTDFEEALQVVERFGDELLGVVSDCEFPRAGELDRSAGFELCRMVGDAHPGVRLVLQSSAPENRVEAEALGASFLRKDSATLLQELREILVERFGFGAFRFRMPDGEEMDRATDLRDFAAKLRTIPIESFLHHARHNHFRNWLKARTEFALAEELEALELERFESPEELRDHVLSRVDRTRLEQHRSVIADFDRERFEPRVTFTRIGGGSLGGKARGAAFANRILLDAGIRERFSEIDLQVPPCIVLGTELFERFLEHPGLAAFAIGDRDDADIEQQFLEAPFPREAVADLNAFLERVRYPLAVRSSSLLEDSLSQPFAGVYKTFMLPNNHLDLQVRWQQLAAAVKRVYASTFSGQAKSYLEMTTYRLEEERMATMIQALVGRAHDSFFYPDFAGVARSHNFYPEPGQRPEDGVVALALGMGRTVVEGSACLRFSPRHPRQLVGFSSVRDALENSQRAYWALRLDRELTEPGLAELASLSLDSAEEHGLLSWVGSTYCPEDDRIVDGISRDGVRLVSFAQVLKHGAYPLAELLSVLLDECSEAMGGPVEIEFAGNLERGGAPAEFGFLQLRPLALAREGEATEIGDPDPRSVLCRSSRVLGNGRLEEIRDVVAIDVVRFERSGSVAAAQQVARFDAMLRRLGRPYLLIGVGRWGSTDPALGIPVQWSQIAGARAIVETGFQDMKVEPSQGTHFFQNLTAYNVGYFTVNPGIGPDRLDWDWLQAQPAADERDAVRHLRLDAPLLVQMNGRTGEGLVTKPRTD